MSDELLPYYNRELSFLRRLGAEFAQAHPKIAQRLRLGPDASEDPHVERLIQAAALLNARTRLKLEDDFPELTDALLGVLYPHYQLPVPSMAVVQFQPQTPNSVRLKVRAACSHVPQAIPEPLPTDHLASDLASDVRYRVDHASDGNLARLQQCLQRFPSVVGIEFNGPAGS